MCISPEAMETQKMLIKLGSIENTQGEVWDHQGKTEVAEIFISYGDHVINFVQFLYVENECLVLSERQGSTTIGKFFTLVSVRILKILSSSIDDKLFPFYSSNKKPNNIFKPINICNMNLRISPPLF